MTRGGPVTLVRPYGNIGVVGRPLSLLLALVVLVFCLDIIIQLLRCMVGFAALVCAGSALFTLPAQHNK